MLTGDKSGLNAVFTTKNCSSDRECQDNISLKNSYCCLYSLFSSSNSVVKVAIIPNNFYFECPYDHINNAHVLRINMIQIYI